MIILILGPQASGKGTQAALLSQKYNLFHFEAGDFLRTLAKSRQDIKEKIDKGILLEDKEMFLLVKEFLEKKSLKDNLVLDGYPRSVKQYQLLKAYLQKKSAKIDKAFLIQISDKEAVHRLSGRRMDKLTGKIYNLTTNPPGADVDPENLIQRDDDKPEAIKVRLASYHQAINPLLDELRSDGLLIEIDGERPIKTIHQDLVKAL